MSKKMIFSEIDVAISNALPEMTVYQRDRLIRKLQTGNDTPIQEETSHLNKAEYLQSVQRHMFKLHNDTPGATFGDVVRYVADELGKVVEAVEMRDRMLPTQTLFGGVHLPPDATEAEIIAFEQAWENGTLLTENTMVGITVVFGQPQKRVGHRVDGIIFHGTPDEAFKEIMPQILAVVQRIPAADDIGNKSIEGLSKSDIVDILKALSPYRYIHKKQYNDKVLEQFDLYWDKKIEPAIKAVGIRKRRVDAKKHFQKTVKDCFLAYEKRTNPAQYFKEIGD